MNNNNNNKKKKGIFNAILELILFCRYTATHHLLVRGETNGHPAICVCTHLVLHICPDAAITQEVVARFSITPWLPISVERINRKIENNT